MGGTWAKEVCPVLKHPSWSPGPVEGEAQCQTVPGAGTSSSVPLLPGQGRREGLPLGSVRKSG